MGPMVHVVLFQFKAGLEATVVNETCKRMLALEHDCVHPETGKPYIKSSSGGKDNSPEGLQNGLTHAFVIEFENEQDRAYYCFKDPVHQAFLKEGGPTLEKLTALDYEPGVF